jgi:acyl-CoA reductase-like NAD-dependent aldehyde dehydrogenase
MNFKIALPSLCSLIDGTWVDGKETVVLRYPHDNRPVAEIALTALADVVAAVESSQRAFEGTRAFVGTNVPNERISFGLPVIRSEYF